MARNESLLAAVKNFDAAEDRQTKARRIAEAICSSGPYRWVGVYDVNAESVTMIAYFGPSAPAYSTFPSTAGLTGEAIRLRQAIVSNDVSDDPRYLTAHDTTGSEMIVPILTSSGRVVGTIDVESDRLNAFTDADVAAVSACVDVVRAELFT